MWSMEFLSEYRVEVNLSKCFQHADILTYCNSVSAQGLKGVRLVAVQVLCLVSGAAVNAGATARG